jgi:hypothetical protein
LDVGLKFCISLGTVWLKHQIERFGPVATVAGWHNQQQLPGLLNPMSFTVVMDELYCHFGQRSNAANTKIRALGSSGQRNIFDLRCSESQELNSNMFRGRLLRSL